MYDNELIKITTKETRLHHLAQAWTIFLSLQLQHKLTFSMASQAVPLDSAIDLLDRVESFLLISFHSLLYGRCLYPRSTFLTTRSFNLAVHQSRHPRVCSWIKDAVSSICSQLAKGLVHKVVFVVFCCPKGQQATVVERWVFDLESFPALPEEAWDKFEPGSNDETATDEHGSNDETGDADVEEDSTDSDNDNESSEEPVINWEDVDESLRATIQKLQVAAETAAPMPPGCTYTIVVETRDRIEPSQYGVSF